MFASEQKMQFCDLSLSGVCIELFENETQTVTQLPRITASSLALSEDNVLPARPIKGLDKQVEN